MARRSYRDEDGGRRQRRVLRKAGKNAKSGGCGGPEPRGLEGKGPSVSAAHGDGGGGAVTVPERRVGDEGIAAGKGKWGNLQ